MRLAKTFAAAVLTALLAAGSASAATLDNIGGVLTFSGTGSATALWSQTYTSADSFTEYFGISFTSPAKQVSLQLTGTPSISGLSSSFTAVDPTLNALSTQPVFTLNAAGWSSSSSSSFFKVGDMLILAISGSLGNNATGSYTANVEVSSVPLPAALPLFGAALIGLGALGGRRKAKKAA